MLENRQGNDGGANPRHAVESDASNRSLIVVIIGRISGMTVPTYAIYEE